MKNESDLLMDRMRRQSRQQTPVIRLINSSTKPVVKPRSMLAVLYEMKQNGDPDLVYSSALAQARHYQDRTGQDPLQHYLQLQATVQLWPYQREGVDFMLKRESDGKNVLLCDEMGLGKTKQRLTLVLESNQRQARLGQQRFSDGPTLVVCRKMLIPHWLGEVAKFPRQAFVVLDLSETETVLRTDEFYYSQCDLIFVTYQQVADAFQYGNQEDTPLTTTVSQEALRIRYKVLFGREWRRIDADEAHEIAVESTLVARAMMALQARSKCAITGTPLQNRPSDLRTLLRFIGESQDESTDLTQILQQCMLRRTKAQLQRNTLLQAEGQAGLLRPAREVIKIVPLIGQEKVLYYAYAQFAHQVVGKIKEGTPVLIHWLRQLCTSPRLIKNLVVPHGMILLGSTTTSETDTGKQKKGSMELRLALRNFMQNFPLKASLMYKSGKECEQVEWDPLKGTEEWMHQQELAQHYHLLESELQQHGTVTHAMCESNHPLELTQAMLLQQSRHRVLNLTAASCKERAILDYITETPVEDKLVVFSISVSFLHSLQRLWRERNGESALISGRQSDSTNVSELSRWRGNPKVRVILCSLKKGGQGLDLDEANHVLLADEWWNPAALDQAKTRVQRPGQKKPVTVVRFVMQHTRESYVMQVQQNKQRMVSETFDEEMEKESSVTIGLFDYTVDVIPQ